MTKQAMAKKATAGKPLSGRIEPSDMFARRRA